MDKNRDVYCASLLMFKASQFLYKHDEEFSNFLLGKTKEYIESIEVDEKLIQEVEEYGRQLEERLKNEDTTIWQRN